MPGLPSTTSEIESPTGCTKQLMSVACSCTPAAELMRPAGMNPASSALKKRFSHFARSPSASTCASARATRRRTSAMEVSPFFAYFSTSASRQISWSETVTGWRLSVGLSEVDMLFFCSHMRYRLHVIDRTVVFQPDEATNCGVGERGSRNRLLFKSSKDLEDLRGAAYPLGSRRLRA